MKAARMIGGMILALMAFPATARAEQLPDYVLDKDYQNCVGSDTADKDRAAYCDCVRNGMRGWDINAYMAAATQAAASAANPSGSQMPGKLEDLARQCMLKVLH